MPTQKIQVEKPVKKVAAKKSVVVKKPAVAKVAKKAVAKKVAKPKADSAKKLIRAKESECFWTTDGHILRDLSQLEQALKAMNAKVFSHHVQAGKNDFADWVEYILEDVSCAQELRKTKTLAQTHKVVVKHLKTYKI